MFLLTDRLSIGHLHFVITIAESSHTRAEMVISILQTAHYGSRACVTRNRVLRESTNSWPTSAIITGVAQYNRRTLSI